MLLGDLLEDRRRVLGYASRSALARKGVIPRQLAEDIETASGDRINHFEPGALRQIAQAYAVTYESVLAFLRGEARELTFAPGTTARPPNRKHHAVDEAPPERWKLLGRLLRVRRVELGYRYRPGFARDRLPKTAQGNLMVRALNAIENGERPGTYAPGTLEMYARAYEVTIGSVHAVLRGEADALAPAHATGPLPVLPPRAPMDDPEREAAARPYFARVYDRVLELADAGVSDPSGEELGLPPEYADAFNAARRVMSRGDAAWLVADMMRRAAARTANPGADAAGA